MNTYIHTYLPALQHEIANSKWLCYIPIWTVFPRIPFSVCFCLRWATRDFFWDMKDRPEAAAILFFIHGRSGQLLLLYVVASLLTLVTGAASMPAVLHIALPLPSISLTAEPGVYVAPWQRMPASPAGHFSSRLEVVSDWHGFLFIPVGFSSYSWIPHCSHSSPFYVHLLFLTACPVDFQLQPQRRNNVPETI